MQDLMRNLLLGGGGGFSPQSLFTGGVEGALYDPSDLSTLYQDSAGTTPVTGVEQVVGLMLDKSQGLVLGSELVTNGDFDTNVNGWTLTIQTGGTGTFTWDAGKGRLTVVGTFVHQVNQGISVTAGKWYKITGERFLISGAATSSVSIRDTTDPVTSVVLGGAVINAGASSDSFSLYYLATSTTTVYLAFRNGNNGAITDIDNISVREIPGNHATSTGSARPTLSARVNLLTYSEEFDNGAWQTANSGSANPIKTANQGIAPDGTNTADRIDFGAITNATDYSRLFQSFTSVATTYVGSVYLKAFSASDVGKKIFVWLFDSAGRDTQTVTLTDSWQRISSTSALTAGTSFITLQTAGSSVVTGGGAQAATSALVWGADLRPANIGVNIPSYQRIAAATDYDTNGFPFYLSFGGAQSMSTPANLDLTGTDKVSVFAGVRKLVNTPDGIIAELSASVSANNGAFGLYAPSASGAATLRFASKGTIIATTDGPAGFTAPATAVVNAFGDISGDLANLRFNGSQSSSSTTDQGTGNYGTYPLFIGARNNASSFFTGYLYSLIIQGTTASATQLASTEAWVNQKTKAY